MTLLRGDIAGQETQQGNRRYSPAWDRLEFKRREVFSKILQAALYDSEHFLFQAFWCTLVFGKCNPASRDSLPDNLVRTEWSRHVALELGVSLLVSFFRHVACVSIRTF